MKLGFGSDHAGYNLKVRLIEYLENKWFEIKDFGPFSEDRVDYPDFAHPVSLAVISTEVDLGIIMCGSGNGINMAANKHNEIRSALCWEPELATLARQHNNANILALPARFISTEKAIEIVDAFLLHKFEGGRHAGRVNKISC